MSSPVTNPQEGLAHLFRILSGTDTTPINLLDPHYLEILTSRDAFFEDLGMLLAGCVGYDMRAPSDRRGVGLLVALLHLLSSKVDIHRDHHGLPERWSDHPACLPMLADALSASMEVMARASMERRLDGALREWLGRAVAAADTRSYHARVKAEIMPLAMMRPQDMSDVLLWVDGLMLPFRSDRIRALTSSARRHPEARPFPHSWADAEQAYLMSARSRPPKSTFELIV